MKVGILGGSFDPPHNGHLFVAKTLIKNGPCQKIILIPCFKHPFLKPLTIARHRLTMTKFLETDSIKVSSMEVEKKNISYTIETLKALKAQSPKDDFVWIIGEDQMQDFAKWKGWREIKERFGLIVVPRELDISSSDIRKRVKMGKDIESLVPKKVESYIIKHKLYA